MDWRTRMGKIKLFAVAAPFDRDWFRSMGALAHQCARFPLDRSGPPFQVVNVVNARGEYDFDQAFAKIAQHRPDALFVGGDPLFLFRRHQLVPLVARHEIPTIYNQREYVLAGGLISYGTSMSDASPNLGWKPWKTPRCDERHSYPVTS
jgi:hypothetical protein